MHVVINDQEYALAEEATVKDALQLLNMTEEGLAVAVNYAVVPKNNWPVHVLSDGDVVMLVMATQGG